MTIFAAANLTGTFHRLHLGHVEYLRLGFNLAAKVHLTITPDLEAATRKEYPVRSFAQRLENVSRFLVREDLLDRVEIHHPRSPEQFCDFLVNGDFDVAVVEPRLVSTFLRALTQREERGVKPFFLMVKPRTRRDGVEISSRLVDARPDLHSYAA
jgi:phosphopantetheine adenylyltransferase